MGSVFSYAAGRSADESRRHASPENKGVEKVDKLAKVTESSLHEFRGIFDAFDKDGSGFILSGELKEAMERFGREMTHAEAEEMMRMADADGSGQLSFWEFATLMAYNMGEGTNPEEMLHAAFRHFDTDGSGTIDSEELREVMRSMGEDISEPDITGVMGGMDENGDGVIDYIEVRDGPSNSGARHSLTLLLMRRLRSLVGAVFQDHYQRDVQW